MNDNEYRDDLFREIVEQLKSLRMRADEIVDEISFLKSEADSISKKVNELRDIIDFDESKAVKIGNDSEPSDYFADFDDKETSILKEEEVTEVKSTPIKTEDEEPRKPIRVGYSGTPAGNGFDDLRDAPNPRSLYVIEIMSDYKARFYPMKEKAGRLVDNHETLLRPVCEYDPETISSEDFKIDVDDYGQLEYNTGNGRWELVKKCTIW